MIAAAPYLDEDLLLAGAELVSQAGAHGTFERTGDERWLDARARGIETWA